MVGSGVTRDFESWHARLCALPEAPCSASTQMRGDFHVGGTNSLFLPPAFALYQWNLDTLVFTNFQARSLQNVPQVSSLFLNLQSRKQDTAPFS
jgi:hypothetical protein